MNIAIIGAGIIGVTTAYELAADGHAVTVFERHASVAEEASFANAGVISPGWVSVEPSSSKAGKLRHATRRNWMGLPRKNQGPDVYAARLARLQGMALYSRHRLLEVSNRLAYAFDRRDGYLVLLRSEKDLIQVQSRLNVARSLGIPFHEISAIEARQIEPALHPLTPLAGAIYFPQDEVANCRQFAVIVRDAAEQLGARFEFNTPVATIDTTAPVTLHLEGQTDLRRFDAAVLCSGATSMTLLKPLGIRLPLLPTYGYSISAHISEPANAPRSGVIDERHAVSITRLGQRVRVSGACESGSHPNHIDDRALRSLYKVLADWYPSSALLSKGVQIWKGAHLTLPEGLPVIGPSNAPGVWLNLGHGASGWTLACGSARALADQINGQVPDTAVTGLGLERSHSV